MEKTGILTKNDVHLALTQQCVYLDELEQINKTIKSLIEKRSIARTKSLIEKSIAVQKELADLDRKLRMSQEASLLDGIWNSSSLRELVKNVNVRAAQVLTQLKLLIDSINDVKSEFERDLNQIKSQNKVALVYQKNNTVKRTTGL